MKKITLLFLLLSLLSFSQVTTTKFKISGVIFSKMDLDSKTIGNFKKKKDVSILSYEFNEWWKINYNGIIGFVDSDMLNVTDKMLEEKQRKIDDKFEKARILKAEIRKRDSLKNDEIQKKNREIQRKGDSVKKVFNEKVKIARARIEEEEKEKIRIYQSKYNGKNAEQCCSYMTNEIDEFSSKRTKITTRFNLSGTMKRAQPNIQLVKYGSLRYLIFDANTDLGCVSPYSTSKSYVKVKLENNVIVTFYHFDDIECGGYFRLYGKLTQKDIINLKKSPIKSIRMSGTEYNKDFTDIGFKNLFINKLGCIN